MRRHTSRTGPTRGRWTALIALAAGAVMVLSACGSSAPVVVTETVTSSADQVTVPSLSDTPTGDTSSSQTTSEKQSTSSAAPAAKVRITASPKFGSKNVGPSDPVSITAFNATLDHVEMVGSDGSSIDGTIGEDGHTWTKKDRLKYGITYTINGTAVAADGSQTPVSGKLTAVKPKKTMPAYIQIPEGNTVGIAAPIVITFAGTVTNQAAAERALKVVTTDAKGKKVKIEGSWGWMPDEDIQGNGVKQSRVHFRTKDYWPAHTKVTVEANLYGTNYGGGAWGREDLTRHFQIGDDIVIKADVKSFHLLILKDGEVYKNFPVSYGKESIPGRTTVTGVHIVQNKNTDNPDGSFKMCNLEYGYCDVTEYWGVRINNNGEFIHVNKETEAGGLLGKANVSHGCVNMGMADGKWFFDFAQYGMPVDVTGTTVDMSEKDYVWDWSPKYFGDQGWARWKSLSAL